MNRKKNEPHFVLTLPLQVEQWQADILNKRYEYLRAIYNYAQNKLLRQYLYFIKSKEYKSIKTFKDKRKFFKTHKFFINDIKDRYGKPLEISFTEYGISGFVTKLGGKYQGIKTFKSLGINSTNLGALSSSIWASWNRKLYSVAVDGKESKIVFRKFTTLNTIQYTPKNKKGEVSFIGLKVNANPFQLAVKYGDWDDNNGKWMTLRTRKGYNFTAYDITALTLGIGAMKRISIVRKVRNGKFKYYIQITFEGKHDNKNRSLGKGQVGIDVGPTKIALSSLKGVEMKKLAEGLDSIDSKKKLLMRKMDRSRRSSNPENYNNDGTIKTTKGQKLKWNNSHRYTVLKEKLCELERHRAAVRKIMHINLANSLLSHGDTFVVENNDIKQWARRSKEDAKSKKTGKNLSKKRFGKDIGNSAPAEFLEILKNKIQSLGGQFKKVDVKNGATGFDFTDGNFCQHMLKERRITLANGDVHQRDLLAAFNLQHLKLDSDELKEYDIERMKKDYNIFCKLEREVSKKNNK